MNTAKDLFPRMPQAVFDAWIQPEIDAVGWPFPSWTDNWAAFFCDLPLSYWAALEWTLYDAPISQQILHNDTLIRIDRVRITATTHARLTNVQNSSERFWASTKFIRQHRQLPGSPLIADSFQNRLRVVDGHHRLAALFHIGVPIGFETPAWLGST